VHPKIWFYFQMGGNKMKKNGKVRSLRAKTPIHYSPIHLFLRKDRKKKGWKETQPTDGSG
jgi:hypothetical protein